MKCCENWTWFRRWNRDTYSWLHTCSVIIHFTSEPTFTRSTTVFRSQHFEILEVNGNVVYCFFLTDFIILQTNCFIWIMIIRINIKHWGCYVTLTCPFMILFQHQLEIALAIGNLFINTSSYIYLDGGRNRLAESWYVV